MHDTEKSFSKLKLIKTYLISTMAQEDLSGPADICINNNISQKWSFDADIDAFAAKISRGVHGKLFSNSENIIEFVVLFLLICTCCLFIITVIYYLIMLMFINAYHYLCYGI